MRILLFAVAASLVLGQAPQAAPPKPTGGSPAYRQAAQLPARIMDFKAEPASVRAGQPVTLVWSVENPAGTTIEPGLGRVTPRGSRQVTPSGTTTYTLTVRGANDQVLTKTLTVNVAGGVAPGTPVAAAKREVPRLANGKPDFSGVYGAAGGGIGGGRGGAPAGPTLKAGAEKYRVVRGPNDSGALSDCMPIAGPAAFTVPYQFQIIQNPDHMVILHEYPGIFRVVPTNGTAHPVDPDPTWLGDAVGKWDGDTLVVDIVGFNDKTELSGFKHTESLHIVERYSRPNFETLQYEATLEDPNVFEKPWTVARSFAIRTDLAKVDEFVCENNRDYSKFFK